MKTDQEMLIEELQQEIREKEDHIELLIERKNGLTLAYMNLVEENKQLKKQLHENS